MIIINAKTKTIMTLHDYQKRCADFIAAHTNCILSVDMGLGKTAAEVVELVTRA